MPTSIVLDNLKIANPCRADWDAMEWQDEEGRARFCRSCRKNVYNVSMMSRKEAEALLNRHEDDLRSGELCVRFARREDGTILTGDCPVGKQEWRRTKGMFAAIAALFFMAIPSPAARAVRRMTVWTFRHVPPLALLEETSVGKEMFTWLNKPEPPAPMTFHSGGAQLNS